MKFLGDLLRVYNGAYTVESVMPFPEIDALESATVVVSEEYDTLSVCMMLKTGQRSYMPLNRDSVATEGDQLNVESLTVTKLVRVGDKPIWRMDGEVITE